jgi:hypothetical protein
MSSRIGSTFFARNSTGRVTREVGSKLARLGNRIISIETIDQIGRANGKTKARSIHRESQVAVSLGSETERAQPDLLFGGKLALHKIPCSIGRAR